jgi:hypothetical protein
VSPFLSLADDRLRVSRSFTGVPSSRPKPVSAGVTCGAAPVGCFASPPVCVPDCVCAPAGACPSWGFVSGDCWPAALSGFAASSGLAELWSAGAAGCCAAGGGSEVLGDVDWVWAAANCRHNRTQIAARKTGMIGLPFNQELWIARTLANVPSASKERLVKVSAESMSLSSQPRHRNQASSSWPRPAHPAAAGW